MKFRFFIFVLIILGGFAAFCNCARNDDAIKKENPKARSNVYYSQTDQGVMVREYGVMPGQDKNADAAVGCSRH